MLFHFGVDISNTLARTASIMVASGMFCFFNGAHRAPHHHSTFYVGPPLDLPITPRSDLAKQDQIAEQLQIIQIWV